MRQVLAAALCVLLLAGCASLPDGADPASDAPEGRNRPRGAFKDAPSYQEALRHWRHAEDINAWIGARFEYDRSRAMLLSETQRNRSARLAVHPPPDFFAAPSGVCVDLSRFAVETLRAIDPAARPVYLMIEFAPVSIDGNTLRRHWLAGYERDGSHYFFADSKRPGQVAGPYPSAAEFIAEYARYRGREVVAFAERDSYERKTRTLAARQYRDPSP